MKVTLRPEDPDSDAEFVKRVIIETLAVELGAAAWPEPLRGQLLTMQYETRRQGARAREAGESKVIEANGEGAGWLFFARLEDELHLSEIMVLPEFRGRGIGAEAVRQVMALAEGKPVGLFVNVLNVGAIKLYERLGFQRIGGTEVQHEMQARTDREIGPRDLV